MELCPEDLTLKCENDNNEVDIEGNVIKAHLTLIQKPIGRNLGSEFLAGRRCEKRRKRRVQMHQLSNL